MTLEEMKKFDKSIGGQHFKPAQYRFFSFIGEEFAWDIGSSRGKMSISSTALTMLVSRL